METTKNYAKIFAEEEAEKVLRSFSFYTLVAALVKFGKQNNMQIIITIQNFNPGTGATEQQ
jgi:hypothetical protein